MVDIDHTEIWKPVVSFELVYEVSSIGRVKRVARGKASRAGLIRKPQMSWTGYFMVGLRKHNVVKNKFVHVLVAEAFIGPNPGNLQVNHKDANKINNRVENLEWVTRRENMDHAYRMGLMGIGETHSGVKLSNADVLRIRQLLDQGITGRALALQYAVSTATISLIKKRINWSHI